MRKRKLIAGAGLFPALFIFSAALAGAAERGMLHPRHRLADGAAVYNMVNFPWGRVWTATGTASTHAFGEDFGANAVRHVGVSVNPQVGLDLSDLKAAGVEGVRWWMIPDGRNLTFAPDGTPTGLGAHFLADLDAALDLLDHRGMTATFVLLDGNKWFGPRHDFDGVTYGRTDVIAEQSKREALYAKVLAPIFRRMGRWADRHPRRPFPVAAIDLGNELFYGTWDDRGAVVADLQAYVREASSLAHHCLPGVPVTVGAEKAHTIGARPDPEDGRNVSYWKDEDLGVAPGRGLDFYSFHDYEDVSLPYQRKAYCRTPEEPDAWGPDMLEKCLGKRVYLQEFPMKNEAHGDRNAFHFPTGGTRCGVSRAGWISGAWLWNYNSEDGVTREQRIAEGKESARWLAEDFRFVASASSEQASYGPGRTLSGPAAHAFDHERATRWETAWGDASPTAWLQVDFRQVLPVHAVVIEWEDAYASRYRVQSSLNGCSWTDLKAVTDGDGGRDVVSFSTVSARYLRVLCEAKGSPYGYSIWDLEVYRRGDSVPEPFFLRASSTGRDAADAFDGIKEGNESRWETGFGNYADNQWFQVDFGYPTEIKGLKVYWEAAYAKRYALQTSMNGNDWRDVVSVDDGHGGLDTLAFPPVTARYFRLRMYQRGSQWGYSFYELEFDKVVH